METPGAMYINSKRRGDLLLCFVQLLETSSAGSHAQSEAIELGALCLHPAGLADKALKAKLSGPLGETTHRLLGVHR